MAALLESTLSRRVDNKKVVEWLKNSGHGDERPFSESGVAVHKQEFVPFLLNFLRDQSSQALTHGPTTPAKTPIRPRPPAATQGLPDRRACRSAGGGVGSRGASRVQLFSPVSPGAEWDAAAQSASHCLGGISAFSSPSFSTTWSPASRPSGSEPRVGHRVSLGDYIVSPPELQHSLNVHLQRGRRKGGANTTLGGHVKHGGGRGGHSADGEAVRWETGGRRAARGGGGGYGKINEQISPPSVAQLNLNNLEDFPPVGSTPTSSFSTSKPSRRINPTPVSTERLHSKPKSCFTSTPLSKISSSPSGDESLEKAVTLVSPLSLQQERELLKQEKTKRAQQVGSPSPSPLEPCTPTKTELRSAVTMDSQATCPEPSKVTFASELDLLANLYCTCISENLVPNIFLELFFVMQLLTSWSAHNNDEDQEGLRAVEPEVLERCYLRQVHNCVYFAVKVLENQFQLVAHLDKCTLRLLAENERVASFSPDLRERLIQAQDRSTAKISPSVSTFIHSVPFQPATDNRSNFGSDKAFHTFKKQRDIFYEVLREWEDSHKEPGWGFDAALGSRIRGMMSQLTSAGNHSHFARLFLKQLVQMCKGPRVNSSSADAPDADLLGMLGADGLGRLKRLEERLIQPHGVVGPCPPPSFPGHQEFFRDFIKTASCCQLNQHLQDSLCQQLLQLDEVSILSPPPPPIGEGEEDEDGDMEQQDEKQRFSSVLLLSRLLAKFLGFISFLPYQTCDRPSREIRDSAVALRSKSAPVLDVCAVLQSSLRRRRTILTVPWLVEFLSMLDFVGPLLLCYRTALGTLLLLYKKMQLGRCEEMCYLNKVLMVSVLGWLFQIPVIPEDIFFTSEFTDVAQLEESNANAVGLDCIPLVDQQLLYTCCPFLGEFRKLLAAFVSGSTAKSGGIIRKITPTSAELKDTPTVNRSQQKLQVDLEQAFFHNQPPSLRRTVEFVAERVGSNAVKHMKATLVSELVEKGEKMLRDGLGLPSSNPSKLYDSICAQLCESGLEALTRATRFCYEKSPEAIRILLPVETSPAVLSTAENITIRLAAEKACSWLSANITALVRREWKSRYDRVMKALGSPPASDPADVDRPAAEAVPRDRPAAPKRKQENEGETSTSCPPSCDHGASRPSDILIEIKEVLSVAVGPRTDEELPTGSQLTALLQRVGGTLACRKFQTGVSEQMLLSSTVILACRLVSAELPVLPPSGCSEPAAGPCPGSEPPVTALLEQLAELWREHRCSAAPLHLLFAPLTVTAVLKASDTELKNYLFLVRRLVDRGVLSEEEVVSHWKKLTDLALPAELIENFQLPSHAAEPPPPPPAEPQGDLDVLLIAPQTVEGAT
ncbi:codanin-1 [Salarias fasciatus]|uniref:Codanin-1 C-terminal domain-containing protein n=1 Tax=Salarias fasciatus TaxID=181472 RepID=A0A672J5D5_SALFA|nr:codanin-1 [Salarias fasciatus]